MNNPSYWMYVCWYGSGPVAGSMLAPGAASGCSGVGVVHVIPPLSTSEGRQHGSMDLAIFGGFTCGRLTSILGATQH